MLAYFRAALSFVLLFGLFLSPAQAQTRDRGPLVLELPASTRALSLGNAFALGFRDSDAIFYHPGLLGRVQGFGASLQRFSANGTLVGFSAGQSWLGGGVAVGVQNLTYEGPFNPRTTVEHILGLSYDEGTLRDEAHEGVSELAVSVGYGRTLMGMQTGAVGKLVEHRYGSRKAGTAAIDLGVAATPGPVTLGLSVQNLGPDMVIAGGEIPLPTRLILGASTRSAPVGPLDVSASTAVTYRLDSDAVPSLGLEVGYWPVNGRTFVGRVGYRYRSNDFTANPFTFGGAFMGDDIILEYSYQGFETGDPSHRFGIGWR